MKKSKIIALAGVTLIAAATLTACGSSSSSKSETKTYSYVYVTDPDTLDYVVSNRQTTSNLTANFIDGLFENDQYGNLVP